MGRGAWKGLFLLVVSMTPVLLLEEWPTGRSILEKEKADQEARERASGADRRGETPPEAITGSPSGSTVGRASNPYNTKGKPLRGDGQDAD